MWDVVVQIVGLVVPGLLTDPAADKARAEAWQQTVAECVKVDTPDLRREYSMVPGRPVGNIDCYNNRYQLWLRDRHN
jgi:hypothetical protein